MNQSKIILAILLACVMLFSFTACHTGGTAATDVTEDPNLSVTEYVLIADDAADLFLLNQYPNLVSLDLRGSTCYDAIVSYIETHPDIHVDYDVMIGTKSYNVETTEIILTDMEYDYSELVVNLAYLPNLRTLNLPKTTLPAEHLNSIIESYPDVTVSYTVMFLGQEFDPSTESIDLSEMLPEQLDEAIDTLSKLPCLNYIQLMNSEGKSELSVSDVKKLTEAKPDAVISYTFELFGQMISTTDERVEFTNIHIGNECVEQIREALDILPNCTYLLMDTCGVDNEVMAQMREDYAERLKVVWRVWLVDVNYNSRLYLRTGSYLTDTHRIRTTYVNDENSHVLNYCVETKYVDVGHVWQLTQCEFLAYMPDLEVCIIAITEITDITPLANHDKLEYLELFTTDISDLSPLLSCPNIEHLNISNMRYLDDITPVLSLTNLKRLRMVDSPLISDAEKLQVAEALPNCNILNQGHFATSWGWRYLDPQKQNPDPRYALLCEQMEYSIDAREYGIP